MLSLSKKAYMEMRIKVDRVNILISPLKSECFPYYIVLGKDQDWSGDEWQKKKC